MSGFPSSVMTIDIPSVASVDLSFTSPANTAITRVLPDSSFSSSSASSWGDSIPWGHWHWYPRIPTTVGQGYYSTVVGQGYREDHHSPNSLPPVGWVLMETWPLPQVWALTPPQRRPWMSDQDTTAPIIGTVRFNARCPRDRKANGPLVKQ